MAGLDARELLDAIEHLDPTPDYDDSAPGYEATTRREPVHHLYHHEFSKHTLSLDLTSLANSPDMVPVYVDGSVITGRVSLGLRDKFRIKEVMIKVRGRASTMYQHPGPYIDDLTFLKIDTSLWTTGEDNTSRQSKTFLDHGDHSWPFSISIPPTFVHEGSTYYLPPTYSEKAYITFNISVVLKRDLLHKDVILTEIIRYEPRTRPGPASELRRLATIHGTSMPGPRLDPAGWFISRFTVDGRLFNQRDVSVEYQIAFTNPRQYTRGTSIPFLLSVVSATDEQAARLLSAPQSWSFILSRCTRLINSTAHLRPLGTSDPASTFVDVMSQGTIWKNTGLQDSAEWPIQGEINIPSASYPTFRLPNITVDYAVRMIPVATGFKPRRQPHHTDVVVVTSHARLSTTSSSIPEAAAAPTYQDSYPMRLIRRPK